MTQAGTHEARTADIARLHETIRRVAPELTPFSRGAMSGYGPYHYIYASGREGDTGALMVANQKQYISLYVCAVIDGTYVAEKHASEVGKANVGKGCIRFKAFDDLRSGTLEQIIRETRDWYMAQPEGQRQ